MKDTKSFQGQGVKASFRTTVPEGLIVFAASPGSQEEYFALQLKNGRPYFLFDPQESAVEITTADDDGRQYSDGKWHEIIAFRHQASGQITLDGQYTGSWATPNGSTVIGENTGVFVGGLPQGYTILRKDSGFGGCMKDVKFARGAVVNLASMSSSAVRVNLDGCLSTDSAVNCRGNDSILVYRGKERNVDESGLQPFTEYLYRVIASHEGGSVSSDWRRGRTAAAAPQSVPTPSRVRSINGYSIEVTWDEPATARGVIEKYVLRAYSEEDPREPRVPSASSESANPSTFTGILTGLLPSKCYSVTLAACTLTGCTESSQALNISTPQEAPQEVQPPVAKSFPNSLLLSWNPPKKANGIITQYSLYMDGMLIYSGDAENYTVTGNKEELLIPSRGLVPLWVLFCLDLVAFTPHQFVLSACTPVGCTNSSLVILYTAQLPPEHVDSPMLTVLDSRTIYVQWKQPRKVNGILERYVLYISNHTHDFTVWDVIYNSTELFQDHVLQHLLPGSKYLIKLGACTGGGCTVSEASQALTEERAPEGVPAPRVHSHSPHSFNISWTEPDYPNAGLMLTVLDDLRGGAPHFIPSVVVTSVAPEILGC
ncbi:hypothetical protein CB1_001073090 [Camelus ferus]|nr:hypothetical protein CB1_001073090 [Camelus ferus]